MWTPVISNELSLNDKVKLDWCMVHCMLIVFWYAWSALISLYNWSSFGLSFHQRCIHTHSFLQILGMHWADNAESCWRRSKLHVHQFFCFFKNKFNNARISSIKVQNELLLSMKTFDKQTWLRWGLMILRHCLMMMYLKGLYTFGNSEMQLYRF